MSKSWKDASRTAWHTVESNESGSDIGSERMQIGCLQRIADATEAMAQNWTSLTASRDEYKRGYESEKGENAVLRHRVAALRGIVKRQKNGGRRAR